MCSKKYSKKDIRFFAKLFSQALGEGIRHSGEQERTLEDIIADKGKARNLNDILAEVKDIHQKKFGESEWKPEFIRDPETNKLLVRPYEVDFEFFVDQSKGEPATFNFSINASHIGVNEHQVIVSENLEDGIAKLLSTVNESALIHTFTKETGQTIQWAIPDKHQEFFDKLKSDPSFLEALLFGREVLDEDGNQISAYQYTPKISMHLRIACGWTDIQHLFRGEK